MRLGWYINRLRSMEPAELLHRVREKALKLRSRGRHEGWERYPARPLRPVFAGLAERVGAASPAQRQAIAAAADDILAGKFSALGRHWPVRDPSDLWPEPVWRLDPVTGGSWPVDYAFDIDFRGGGSRGDIKYVWEFNRLQSLPVLAAFALLEGNFRAVAAIEMAIQSWHAANPPFRGVGWASGIEVALRAISLIVTLDIAGDRIGEDTHRLAGEILSASAFWLPRFPSLFSSANNHLVAELAGEYLVALARGTTDERSRAGLSREVLLQVLPDGSGAEQSPTYTAFTAELALLCVVAGRSTATPFSEEVEQRLAAFGEFVDWLGPIRFGDDDEGRAVTRGEPDYAASVAAAIGGALRRPGRNAGADDFRAMLFGTPPSSAAAPVGLRTFPHGGLSLWHGDIAGRHVDLGFDHGPLGYLSIAAHGHADALSVTLALDGRPVLVDPGTYLYGSGGEWRRWFRSTPAHNTLSIDGESQSLMSGAFNWSHKAVATLEESRPEPDWRLRAAHDGYLGRFGGIHERTIEPIPGGIRLRDSLLRSHHVAEIAFQLAPGLTARTDGSTVTVRDGPGALLLIQFPSDAIVISVGREGDPSSGWVSPRFGIRKSALRLSWRGIVDEAGVETLLKPVAAGG